MSHDLRISARVEKSPAKIGNKFTIQGGSKLEVFDEDGGKLYEGEFKSFTSNFLKLLYGSMVGAGTAKAKDLSGNSIEMDSFPQCTMNMGGGSSNYRFGLVVGTGDSAVGVNEYVLVSPATGLNYGNTVIGSPSVGSTSVSLEISRQIGNATGSTVVLKEAGLICGADGGITGNTLIARDLLSITLENGKKSVWRYTINFNFTAGGGFVKGLADNFAKLFVEATSSAPWTARAALGCVAYDNKMWVIGGNAGSNYFHDVWYSTDGVSWTQATSSAPWTARANLGCVAYNNKMWVIGGYTQSGHVNDVWYSTDGVSWTQATSSAPWTARAGFGVIVYNNKMWVMGGDTQSGRVNDVWYSTDGVSWIQATSSAPWTARSYGFGVIVYNNKMWVMGGNTLSGRVNDVWYSTDGVSWTQATSSAPWGKRNGIGCIAYDGKIRVIGGVDISDVYLNDVWFSSQDVATIIPGSSDSAFSATATALGALIANGTASGQLVYGDMPDTSTKEPSVTGNKTKFSLAREFSNSSGADITIREVGLFSGSTMLARLILANPVTIANGQSDVITVDFETEV